jgi:hypothetical protein
MSQLLRPCDCPGSGATFFGRVLKNVTRKTGQEVHNDRAANGGKLTPAERRQANRQENSTSRAIYRKKHNGRLQ